MTKGNVMLGTTCPTAKLHVVGRGVMKYQINTNELMKTGKITAWELGMKNWKCIKAIMAVFLAGDICLTQEGYDKLDDSLKSLFIAKK